MLENLCQRVKLGVFGEGKQKMSDDKQTFEQIPLTFRVFTGKMVYGIMYGMLGSMVP